MVPSSPESAESTGLLKPEEIIPACLGELYRYRLAVQNQLPRIDAATRALRAQREQIEKDEREHLFVPSMDREAWKEQLNQIQQRDVPEIWRLKTEAQFILVAVYGILSMARAIRSASTSDLNGCVQRAISTFDKAAPDADLLRHLHEHIDAYMGGEGKDRHRLPDPTLEGVVAMLDEGLVYFIGGKLFRLAEIIPAAEELARAVAACAQEAGL
jgi:hypothetical protein